MGSTGYDSAAFPPHSGDVVIWDASDDAMTVSFTNPQSDVGFWYTSLNPITLTAFDSSYIPLGLALGSANTDGTTGTSDFLSISESGIASIAITSVAGQYVLDDLQFSSGPATATPEPASVFLTIVGGALTAMTKFRKSFHNSMRKALILAP